MEYDMDIDEFSCFQWANDMDMRGVFLYFNGI